MKFQLPIQEGEFIKRYKRFFADIQFENETITAHVPNTGSMKGCLWPGHKCRFTVSDDPKRKLKYTLQMVKSPKTWIGVNTHLANDLAHEAFTQGRIKHWKRFSDGRREVKINEKSRMDLVLWEHDLNLPEKKRPTPEHFEEARFHFVEVKNVTLADGDVALFPDSVTTRGQKHLQELIKLTSEGHSAEMLFVVQRTDCTEFRPADDIDPEYGYWLREAKKSGVKLSAYAAKFLRNKIELATDHPLPIVL